MAFLKVVEGLQGLKVSHESCKHLDSFKKARDLTKPRSPQGPRPKLSIEIKTSW